MTMRTYLYQSLVALLLFTLLTGIIYPLVITGLAQAFFPKQAHGSLIEKNGMIVGSELIGQYFDDPKYFWGRPSATTPYPYNASGSNGSNLGPNNPSLEQSVKNAISRLKTADPLSQASIPVDLVTTSGSGLDPDISLESALYQVPRVARMRGLSDSALSVLVHQFSEPRQFGFLGEPRVNVLKINLALDEIK
jgi:K+-transporting ATPase ATPase C chain